MSRMPQGPAGTSGSCEYVVGGRREVGLFLVLQTLFQPVFLLPVLQIGVMLRNSCAVPLSSSKLANHFMLPFKTRISLPFSWIELLKGLG